VPKTRLTPTIAISPSVPNEGIGKWAFEHRFDHFGLDGSMQIRYNSLTDEYQF